jgi:3-oxoacyl-[acyl-carrier-protein] synthase II
MGIVSTSGMDLDSYWTSLVKGESNVGLITRFDTSSYDVKMAGEINSFNIADYGFPFMLTRQLDVFTHYAMAATKMAINHSGIVLEDTDREKVGVFAGNCLGGVGFGERELFNLYRKGYKDVSPYQSISWFYTAPQGQISIFYKLKGFSKTFVADRISSDIAIGYAFKSILLNRIDACFVCGTEAGIFPYGFLGFMESEVMSRRNDRPSTAYRPYDLDRDGLVLGEGAGVLLIEELEHAIKRNAKIYGEIIAFESNCDGVHHKNHDNDGSGYRDVIESCISKAKITPKEIDYINLDGSGLKEDDIIETNVLKKVFGNKVDNIALSCPKTMFGHTFGAAGAIDAIINCLVLKNGRIPPTINYENFDKQCDLNYTPNRAVDKEVNTVLQIARGRGGINSAMIIGRYNS